MGEKKKVLIVGSTLSEPAIFEVLKKYPPQIKIGFAGN